MYCPPCRPKHYRVECDWCSEIAWRNAPVRYCSPQCKTAHAIRKPGTVPRRKREHAAPGLRQHERLALLARWRRQLRRCAYCPELADTIDHVVPLLLGGTNREGNLAPCCRRCNGSKGSRLLMQWRGRPMII
jgi:5-methylcytosine-specific restriction endonuclease McrA